MIITVKMLNGSWVAVFSGGDVPQNTPLPLPWAYQARSQDIVDDLQRRFPRAKIYII